MISTNQRIPKAYENVGRKKVASDKNKEESMPIR
jgi:hypothetical protein